MKSGLQTNLDNGRLEIIEEKPAVDVAEGMTFTDAEGNKYAVVRVTDDEVVLADDLVYKARQAGYKVGDRVSEFARQGNLFEEDGATVADYHNAVIMMLADVLNDSRVTQLKKVIAVYNERAEVPAQGIDDMFVGKVSKEQIINEIRKAFNYGQSEQDTSTPTTTERQGSGSSGSEQGTLVGESNQGGERGEIVDKQGNPINEDGTLKVEKIKSIDELPDEDFSNPTRSVQLPQLPLNVDSAIGANGKPVVIKKNIFERNSQRHPDISAEESRDILLSALYSTDLYGQNQKAKRPYNWIVINTKDNNGKSRIVLLEVNPNKDNIEIVHWHYIDKRGLDKIKRQAEREDGQLLILPSEHSEEAGALSSRTNGLPSVNKDTNKSKIAQKEDNEIQEFQEQWEKDHNLYEEHKKEQKRTISKPKGVA